MKFVSNFRNTNLLETIIILYSMLVKLKQFLTQLIEIKNGIN